MASIIQGFEYDIFISYRQKDNKHDGWVTKFVDNLKGELEATIKEDVSVYFDENPHDRLQETHNVDKSLEGKLKCLIFIPILSKTYCDPNSYAWQYELLTFIRMAEQDRFGKDVSLRSGNVASRILPIRIHDLEPEDIKLFEKETESVLRAMDFVFKTASGVNRPLKANEDHPQDNLNKTFYSDQINKVANAIDEIIHSLKGKQPIPVNKKLSSDQPYYNTEEDKSKVRPGTTIINKKSKRWLIIGLSIILCFAAVFVVFKIMEGSSKKANDIAKLEKSIAVLPFVNDSPDQENTYFINGIMDEILNNLQKIKDFRVLSRTSTEQYRGSNKPTIPKIAKELGVNYIVEGSGQKYGNKFVLRVQLIAAKNEKHLWGESFEQEIKETSDIINLQSQVAKAIAEELKASITPKERQLIEKTSTTNLTAYDFYQRGREEHEKYWLDNKDTLSLKKAEFLYHKSLETDSKFGAAYTGLADVYWSKHGNEAFFSKNYLDSVIIYCDKALSYDNQLEEAYVIRGKYFLTINKPEEARKEFDKAIELNPNYWESYWGRGWLHHMYYNDRVLALDDFQRAISIYRGAFLPHLYSGMAYSFLFAGFVQESKDYFEDAFRLDDDSLLYYYSLSDVEISSCNYENSIRNLKKAYAVDTNNIDVLFALATSYVFNSESEEALKYFKKCLERGIEQNNALILAGLYYNIGYTYLQKGDKEKAEYYFSKQIGYSEKQIVIGRTTNFISQKYSVLASVYLLMGKKEEAYKNLRIINKMQKIDFPTLNTLKLDSTFNSIRDEPEFQQIVKDMESKYHTEHERVRKWMEEQGQL